VKERHIDSFIHSQLARQRLGQRG